MPAKLPMLILLTNFLLNLKGSIQSGLGWRILIMTKLGPNLVIKVGIEGLFGGE